MKIWNRVLIISCSALVPVFLFMNIYQAYEYEQVRKEVSLMELTQGDWLEKKKKLFTGITILSSPSRILSLAEKEFQMVFPTSEQVIKFFLKKEGAQ